VLINTGINTGVNTGLNPFYQVTQCLEKKPAKQKKIQNPALLVLNPTRSHLWPLLPAPALNGSNIAGEEGDEEKKRERKGQTYQLLCVYVVFKSCCKRFF